jgi:DNA-binding response OmpR family regulator
MVSKQPYRLRQRAKKILIVDDEPDITLTLGKGLEQGGYDVQASSSIIQF